MIAKANGERWHIPDDEEDFYDYLEELDAPTEEVREVIDRRHQYDSGDIIEMQAGGIDIELRVE